MESGSEKKSHQLKKVKGRGGGTNLLQMAIKTKQSNRVKPNY